MYPVQYFQAAMESFHVHVGLPWWGTIVVSTILLRVLLLPLTVYQYRYAARISHVQPEMEALTLEIRRQQSSGEWDATANTRSRDALFKIYQKHGVSPMGVLRGPLVQGPIMMLVFGCWFNGAVFDGFTQGGTLWFPNLCEADNQLMRGYLGLPGLSSLATLVAIELGSDNGGMKMTPKMQWGFRIFAGVLPFFTAHFGSGVLVYWATSAVWGVIQGSFLRQKFVRQYFSVPDRYTKPKLSPDHPPSQPYYPSFSSKTYQSPSSSSSAPKPIVPQTFSSPRKTPSSSDSPDVK